MTFVYVAETGRERCGKEKKAVWREQGGEEKKRDRTRIDRSIASVFSPLFASFFFLFFLSVSLALLLLPS